MLALTFSVCICLVMSFMCGRFCKTYVNHKSNNSQIAITENTNEDLPLATEDISFNINDTLWCLEIPKIGLKANIAEGTDAAILNQYIGHFTETQVLIGNVGLAAHNRGYPVNYFERIKELAIGDEIYYTLGNVVKKYVVCEKKKIKDTQWETLENTEDNRLTLITCVENEPAYRRSIQAVEVTQENRNDNNGINK